MSRYTPCPDQTSIRYSCDCQSWQLWRLSVSADCPGVTAADLGHLDNFQSLDYLSVGGLANGSINYGLLMRLRKHTFLKQLALGRPSGLQEANVPAFAVKRSVGEGRTFHTHTASYSIHALM